MVKFSRYRPKQALGIPVGEGFRIFMTFDTVKVVRLSPLRTGRLYPQEYPDTHFQSLSRPQGTWFSR
jgi:hypothetical protein